MKFDTNMLASKFKKQPGKRITGKREEIYKLFELREPFTIENIQQAYFHANKKPTTYMNAYQIVHDGIRRGIFKQIARATWHKIAN